MRKDRGLIVCLVLALPLMIGAGLPAEGAHQDHMHLDVIDRKSGARYCR